VGGGGHGFAAVRQIQRPQQDGLSAEDLHRNSAGGWPYAGSGGRLSGFALAAMVVSNREAWS
jgi:hypothetical protein